MIEGTCAYCGHKRAVNRDHVVPRSLRANYMANVRVSRKRHQVRPLIPDEFMGLVPACFACNARKGSRRLVPRSWEHKIDALNDFFGGTPWRVWSGDTSEPAYREVHV